MSDKTLVVEVEIPDNILLIGAIYIADLLRAAFGQPFTVTEIDMSQYVERKIVLSWMRRLEYSNIVDDSPGSCPECGSRGRHRDGCELCEFIDLLNTTEAT